jgi:hypothetical protein
MPRAALQRPPPRRSTFFRPRAGYGPRATIFRQEIDMALNAAGAVNAINAVSGSGGRISGQMPGLQAERFGSSATRIDLGASLPQTAPAATSNTGGAYLRRPLSATQDPAIAPLHLGALDNAIRDGFRDGFVSPQTEKLIAKVSAMNKPGSTVNEGELMIDTMILSARTSLATVFAKAATKLAESLNSIVTKQG